VLPAGTAAEDIAAHDRQAAGLARHKPGPISADDAGGYHRVTGPAAAAGSTPIRPSNSAPSTGPSLPASAQAATARPTPRIGCLRPAIAGTSPDLG